MQTFLPHESFAESAKCLDYRRLGKQRVEAWQVLRTLTGISTGWQHHPVMTMWRGHEDLLRLYGAAMCREWTKRGYVDNMLHRFTADLDQPMPPKPWWLGYEPFHISHQSNLIRKLPDHYMRYFPNVSNDIPYYWPPVDRP